MEQVICKRLSTHWKGRMMHIVYIALGTNLGERSANLQEATRMLEKAVKTRRLSPIYETPPWGYLDQPAFLNQVLEVETDLSPQDLHSYTKQVESRVGRTKTFRFGPRKIDLDILFYDDLVLETENLAIPHPRIEGRGFVLVPMSDLAPDLRHPVLGKTILQLCAESDRTGIVQFEE
jgi:2-amino-4-hydroxy-6-hydroxymethyldihydropteridine diphosphokinase